MNKRTSNILHRIELNQTPIYFISKLDTLIEYLKDPNDGDYNHVLEELIQLRDCIME